jgi:hypothetical protein
VASTEVTVSLRLDTRLYRAWLHVLKVIHPILGPDRTMHWATRGVRLIRLKTDNGPWERPFVWSEDGP